MTSRFQDVDLSESWSKIPLMRRHCYFYLLLLLVTMVAASLKEPVAAPAVSGEDAAPALSAAQVYSPPAAP